MSLNLPTPFQHHQNIMEGLRKLSVLFLLVLIVHQAPASISLGNKVLHIPEKIIGGVIDIVQSHKNKPSQQSTFQQNIQTETTFSQQGNLHGAAGNAQWTGPAYQGAGLQSQTQFQAQGQIGFGNQVSGNLQGTPASVYPVNNGPAITGTPGLYPVNPGPYPPQQGFSQPQNQGQQQGFQNQFQNQNQQGNFQGQSQNQVQNQNSQHQTGQYGTGSFQGIGQYAPSNGNYQNVGQAGGGNYQNGQSSGNYHGSVGQTGGGNYQSSGQASGGNYQSSGQASGGNYQSSGQASGGNYQSGNYQNVQTGQYQGTNGQFNQNQQGQYGQTGQNQSGYYQGSQTSQPGQNNSGTHTGSFVSQSGGFQTSQQSGGPGPSCVCQAWTKPPASHVQSDESPKPDKVDKKTEDKESDE